MIEFVWIRPTRARTFAGEKRKSYKLIANTKLLKQQITNNT